MANRYWVGTGTWNTTNTTNWSTASNGSGGASVPSSADAVIFNASSGNCTLGSQVQCLTLVMTGYSGIFDAGSSASNYQILIWSQGTATVFVAQTSGTVSGYPVINLYTSSSLSRTITALTGASGSKWNVVCATAGSGSTTIFTTNSIFNDVNIQGITNITSTTVTFQGNVNFGSSVTRTAGTSVLTLSSQTSTIKTLNITNTYDCPITFDSPSGGYKLTSNIYTSSSRTLTFTQGTLDLNNFNVSAGFFSSTGTINRTLAFGTSGYINLSGGSGTHWNVTTTGSPTLTITGTSNVRIATLTSSTTLNPGTPTEANAINFTYINSGILTLTTGNYGDLSFDNPSSISTSSGNCIVYGSLTNLNITTSTTSTFTLTLATSGSKQLGCYTNGSFGNYLVIDCTGTYTLTNNLTTAKTFTLTRGNLNLSNFNITAPVFSSNNQNTRSLSSSNNNSSIYVTANATTIVDMSDMTNFSVLSSITPNIVPTYSGSSGTRVVSMGTIGGATESNVLNFGHAGTSLNTDTLTVFNGSSYRNLKIMGGSISNNLVKITGADTLNDTTIYNSYQLYDVNILASGGNLIFATSKNNLSLTNDVDSYFFGGFEYANHPTIIFNGSGTNILTSTVNCNVIFKKGTLIIGSYYTGIGKTGPYDIYSDVVMSYPYTFDMQTTDAKVLKIIGPPSNAIDTISNPYGAYLRVYNFNPSGNSSFTINSTGYIQLYNNSTSSLVFNSGNIISTFPVISIYNYSATVIWNGSAKFTNLISPGYTGLTLAFANNTTNTFIDFSLNASSTTLKNQNVNGNAKINRINGNWASNTNITNGPQTGYTVTLGYATTTTTVTYKNNFFLMF
jgi:hypothetical protein